MEIRPVQQEESEEFLRVLCDAFDLNFGRAISIFYTEPFFDLNRKWALFEGGKILSVLTTTPLTFGWGRAIGISGVATVLSRRREGLGAKLLRVVLESAERDCEGPALLFARDVRLYETVGFEQLDRVERCQLKPSLTARREKDVQTDFVQARYNQWAEDNPNRLRRDTQRWSFWNWHMRVCQAIDDGYLCTEGGTVREVVATDGHDWPKTLGSEWFGLRHMRNLLGLTVVDEVTELFFMGYHFPAQPEMFMTDQF